MSVSVRRVFVPFGARGKLILVPPSPSGVINNAQAFSQYGDSELHKSGGSRTGIQSSMSDRISKEGDE
jgi:hypothetical protein